MDSCFTAQKGGANRVELCANLIEGGTTPDYATIVYAKEKLSIEVMVMIRPRGGDFLYTDTEYALMKENILLCRKIGVKGVVFGLLLPDGSIDKRRTRELVDLAQPLEVCFHRAVDMTDDYNKAVKDIIDCKCKRILTSGQKNTAIEGLDNMAKIQKEYGKQIEIMAASGLNSQNVKEIWQRTGINNFHLSAKQVKKSNMIFRQPNVSMGNEYLDEYSLTATNIKEVKRVRNILDNLPESK